MITIKTYHYAVQSPQTFEDIIDPVNRLVHTSGLKNFADTGITSTAKSGISSDSALIVNRDLITNERTDTINYFDYALIRILLLVDLNQSS